MDAHRSLGTHRIIDVRDDDDAIKLAAAATGLDAALVQDRFKKANGRALVRTALVDVWPWSASALGGKTAALARDAGLHAEIRLVTGATKHLVTRRLNASAGKRLLKNAFWDLWPANDAAPRIPLPDAASEANEDETSEPVGDVEATHRVQHDTDPPPPGVRPGALISSRYDVKEEIGRGGFGTSWLAYDRLSGLDLVLKVPVADDGGAIRHVTVHAPRRDHAASSDGAGRPIMCARQASTTKSWTDAPRWRSVA